MCPVVYFASKIENKSIFRIINRLKFLKVRNFLHHYINERNLKVVYCNALFNDFLTIEKSLLVGFWSFEHH